MSSHSRRRSRWHKPIPPRPSTDPASWECRTPAAPGKRRAAALYGRRSLDSARHCPALARRRISPRWRRDSAGRRRRQKRRSPGPAMEDTVARFKPLDGRTLVEPSNKVDLYSPRFNAVRQVVDVEVDQQRHRAAGLAEPVKANIPRTSEPVAWNTQELAADPGHRHEPARPTPLPASAHPRTTPNCCRGRSRAASAPTRTPPWFAAACIRATTSRCWPEARRRQSPGAKVRACRSCWTSTPPRPDRRAETARDLHSRLGAQSTAANRQGRFHTGRRTGRRGLLHNPLRQRG